MHLRHLVVACVGASALVAAQPPKKPKLVVGVVIDQFRYDYLTRFRADYHGGLDRLLRNGADFTNAHYLQTPTKTAVGHSIFMSGAMPAVSGIVSNDWYDRTAKKAGDKRMRLESPGRRCGNTKQKALSARTKIPHRPGDSWLQPSGMNCGMRTAIPRHRRVT